MTTVTLNSKPDCPFCDRARTFMADRGIPFAEVKHDEPSKEAMYDRLGLKGAARFVPQIEIKDGEDDYLISGFKQLRISGLDSLFQSAKIDASPAPEMSRAVSSAGMVEVEEGSACCQ